MQPITITYDIETGRFFADGNYTRRVKNTTNDKILYDIMNFLLDEGIVSSSPFQTEGSYVIGFPKNFELRNGDIAVISTPYGEGHEIFTIGVVVDNYIVYQQGGYDRIEDIYDFGDFSRVVAVFRCDDGTGFDYAKTKFSGEGSIGTVYYKSLRIRDMFREKGINIFSKDIS